MRRLDTLVVAEPVAGVALAIYLAMTAGRLATHRARCWYVRPAADDGDRPVSRAFGSIDEAVAAIRDGSWDVVPSDADRRPIHPRSDRG